MDAIGSSLGTLTDTSSDTAEDIFSLGSLTADFTSALDRALLAFELQAEIEDALDTALLRIALADTPTLSADPLGVLAA